MSFEYTAFFPVILVIIILFLISLFIILYFQKNRRKAMQKFFYQRGWEFLSQPKKEVVGAILPLPLFFGTYVPRVQNLMRKKEFNIEWRFYDATAGGGRLSQPLTIFDVVVHDTSLCIPNFTLEKKTFHFFRRFLGAKRIDLPGFTKFNKKFYLSGENEDEIKSFFDADLVHLFESLDEFPDLVQSRTGIIAIYLYEHVSVKKLWFCFDKYKSVIEHLITHAQR